MLKINPTKQFQIELWESFLIWEVEIFDFQIRFYQPKVYSLLNFH